MRTEHGVPLERNVITYGDPEGFRRRLFSNQLKQSIMKALLKRLSKHYGYDIEVEEVISLWRQGAICVSDKEEDAILIYLENN